MWRYVTMSNAAGTNIRSTHSAGPAKILIAFVKMLILVMDRVVCVCVTRRRG